MQKATFPRYSFDMEKVCQIFVLGDSLFSTSLVQILAAAEGVHVVGTADFPAYEPTAVAQTHPHIIIIANAGHLLDIDSSLLSQFPGVPIIHADLNQDYVQIITSRRVSARRTDLLAAIDELSRQRRD